MYIVQYLQVNRVSPGLLKRVLSHIVETIAEELARLMSCVSKFSPSGIIQARSDITILRNTLELYCTPRAKYCHDSSPILHPTDVTFIIVISFIVFV